MRIARLGIRFGAQTRVTRSAFSAACSRGWHRDPRAGGARADTSTCPGPRTSDRYSPENTNTVVSRILFVRKITLFGLQ